LERKAAGVFSVIKALQLRYKETLLPVRNTVAGSGIDLSKNRRNRREATLKQLFESRDVPPLSA
jgi:hypothetical protein